MLIINRVQGKKKCPHNLRRRERARRRREAWIERRNQSAQHSNATFAGTTAAGTKAAGSADLSAESAKTPAGRAEEAGVNTVTAILSAAAITAEVDKGTALVETTAASKTSLQEHCKSC